MKKHLWLSLVLISITLCVRVGSTFQYGLNWDELNTLVIAKLPLSELFRIIYIRDFHPPAMHVLLHAWVSLFGDSDFTVRLLALSCGLAGVVVSYVFAWTLSSQHRVAFLTALFCACSPLLGRYASVTLQYVAAYPAILLSWLLLWRLMSSERLNQTELLLYGLTTAFAINSYATGVIYFASQGGYFLTNQSALPNRVRWPLLGMALLALLSWLPFLWHVLQPWHVSRVQDSVLVHSKFLLSDLWTLVPQFLFLRDSQVSEGLWLETIAATVLFGLCVWAFFSGRLQVPKPIQKLILWQTIVPFTFLLLFSFALDKPFFLARTLLYSLFGFYLMLAWWLSRSRWQNLVGLGVVLGLSLYTPWQMPLRDLSLKAFGASLARVYQPQDGLLIFPGSQHLSVMRYFRPSQFGLTQRELTFDPKVENAYHMVQRMDAHHFWVSGHDVMQRPEIQEQLKLFLAKNQRVFIYGRPDQLAPYLNCQPNVLMLAQNNQWQPFPCSPN